MDEGLANEIADLFAGTLQLVDTADDRNSHVLIQRALRALPDPDIWTYGSNEGQDALPAALMLSGNQLIHIEAGREDNGPARVSSVTRSLNPSPIVEMDWGDREINGESVHSTTVWRFRFSDDSTTTVTGTVRIIPSEEIDSGEEFARAVAAKVRNASS